MANRDSPIQTYPTLHSLPFGSYDTEFLAGRYTLVPVATQSHVTRGESLTLRLHATGYDTIRMNKIFIALPANELLPSRTTTLDELTEESEDDEPNGEGNDTNIGTASDEFDTEAVDQAFERAKIPGRFTAHLYSYPDSDEVAQRDTFQRFASAENITYFTQIEPLMSPVSTVHPGQSFFSDNPRPSTGSTETFNPLMSEANIAISESGVDGDPPLRVDLNVSEDAPPGDYSIALILTYDNGFGLQQDRQELTVHVNSFYEDHRTGFQILAIIIAGFSSLLAVLGTLGL